MDSLKERLAQLSKDASLSDMFDAMSKWEKEAVAWHRGAEARVLRKGLSGRLHPICNPFRSSASKVNEK